MTARYEVGSILRQHKISIETGNFNGWQQRTLFALSRCRTVAMGGHIDKCNHEACGRLHLSYNSCRNRHCPKCQGHKRAQWIQAREEELLPVGYYHVVFTLPSELNLLALHKPRLLYSILFKTAWEVIRGFGENEQFIGAKAGMIAILHTWGQNMSLHPHLHCIVPAGGVSKEGKWKHAKNGLTFLFPVKAMSKVFRAKFVSELRKNGIKDKALYDSLFKKQWVIYSKKPFGSAATVVEYLGRYTHKIAISNHRIQKVTDYEVTFSLKNYKKNGKKEELTLKTEEFIRRFAQHILPKGFVRIRHYGFLSTVGKRKYLPNLHTTLGNPILKKKTSKTQHLLCPICKKGSLRTVFIFTNRGPPPHWIVRLEKEKNRLKKK